MTVFCRYSSLLFTFGYCKPQFQGLITHSHSHFFFPWPAVLVFMKTLLKEWPGCTYYCHAKSTETCLHWSLPKVSRKNGSQHTSVKNKLETFSEGLAGVFGAPQAFKCSFKQFGQCWNRVALIYTENRGNPPDISETAVIRDGIMGLYSFFWHP